MTTGNLNKVYHYLQSKVNSIVNNCFFSFSCVWFNCLTHNRQTTQCDDDPTNSVRALKEGC